MSTRGRVSSRRMILTTPILVARVLGEHGEPLPMDDVAGIKRRHGVYQANTTTMFTKPEDTLNTWI